MNKHSHQRPKTPSTGKIALAIIALIVFYHLTTQGSDASTQFNPGYFNIGWYHIVTGGNQLGDIYRTGARTTFVQPAFYSDLPQYLTLSNGWDVRNSIGLNPEWFTANGPDLTQITKAIKQYRSSGSIASWSLYDEPDVWRNSRYATPASLKQAYSAIKQVDGKRIFISFSPRATKEEILEYSPAFDFFGIDYYPSLQSNREFGNRGAFDKYAEQVRKGVDLQNQLSKGFRMIIQSFGPNNKEFYRLPTYNEFRFMSLLPLASGAQGNIYYTYQHAKDYPDWIRDTAQPVIDEVSTFRNLNKNVRLTSISSDCAACQSHIRYSVFADRTNPKLNYIVAVNESAEPLRPTFTFNQPATKIETLKETRSAQVGNPITSYTDDFGRYGLHVYKVTLK